MNFFITNREIIGKPGKETIREDGLENAGDNLRFGTYDIQSKQFNLFPEPNDEIDILYKGINHAEPDELFGSTKFFKLLYDSMLNTKEKSDVLFFIHGFNTNLDGVRENFENLTKRYVDAANSPVNHIVIFTWPGRTRSVPTHYHDDKKDAIRSGEALARGIEKVLLFFEQFFKREKNTPCKRNIHLMVHSMGHRVLKHMLLELEKKGIPVPELLKEIILVAGDIEYDIFEPQNAYSTLIDLGDRVHVYFHEKDRVLDISKYTKNFNNRLGRVGRKRVDSSLLYVIDANVTKTSDDKPSSRRDNALNHWYYYTSTEVVEDIIGVLNGERTKY